MKTLVSLLLALNVTPVFAIGLPKAYRCESQEKSPYYVDRIRLKEPLYTVQLGQFDLNEKDNKTYAILTVIEHRLTKPTLIEDHISVEVKISNLDEKDEAITVEGKNVFVRLATHPDDDESNLYSGYLLERNTLSQHILFCRLAQ